MKLLIDAIAATGGAGVVRLRELARWFPVLAPGADLVFVVRPEIAPIVREQSSTVAVWTMRPRLRGTPLRLTWEHLALPRRTRGFVPDIVFSPFNFVPTAWPAPKPRLAVLISNPAPYSEAVLERCRRRELPRLLLLRGLTSRSAAVADRVFIVSRQALELVPVPGLAAKSVLVPHSPPPPHPARPRLGIEIPRVPFLVVAAELYKWKGVETVIEAVALLKDLPRFELVVCGRHLERDYVAMLRRLIARLGVTDRVRLVGPVVYDDLLVLMQHASAVVACSRFENMSRVPVEAMSLDTPVVSCDIPSYRELCGESALYYGEDRSDELAAHLRLLLAANDSSAARMVARGRAHVAALSPETGPRVMLDALKALASDRSRSPVPTGAATGGTR